MSLGHTFKVGDKVWYTGTDDLLLHGRMYIISKVHDYGSYRVPPSIWLEDAGAVGYCASNFKLVQDGVEAELQRLLSVANEGRAAAHRLHELAPDRVEWSNSEPYKGKGLNLTLRLRPQAPVLEPFTLPESGYKVNHNSSDKVLSVGCQHFSFEELRHILYCLVQRNQSEVVTEKRAYQATRTGILTAGGNITWADAELLFNKIMDLK